MEQTTVDQARQKEVDECYKLIEESLRQKPKYENLGLEIANKIDKRR